MATTPAMRSDPRAVAAIQDNYVDVLQAFFPMILACLSLLLRRESVVIREADVSLLEKEAPRARNHVLSRGLKRARMQIWTVSGAALVLAAGFYLQWTPVGMLAFLIYNAALSVFIDLLRYGLAGRWVRYSYARDLRAEDILLLCHGVERGARTRLSVAMRPQPQVTLVVAAAVTLVILPISIVLLAQQGWLSWTEVFGNFLMPILMLAVGLWRVIRAVRWALIVRAATVGSRELMLESDDALDVYAGVAALFWLPLLFGSTAAAVIAVVVVIARLAFRVWRWHWLRESVNLLTQRLERLHPHSPHATATADEYGSELEFSEAELKEAAK